MKYPKLTKQKSPLRINPYKYEIPKRLTIDYKDKDMFYHNRQVKIEIEEKINQLLQETNFKLIQNRSLGTVYYFETNRTIELLNYKYPKGEYILKVEKLTFEEVDNLEKLSDLKLIPKIFDIKELSIQNNNEEDKFYFILIMEFIDGMDLSKLSYQRGWLDNLKDIIFRKYLYQEIEKEVKRWGDYVIGDLNFRNILITQKGKVVFIDPLMYDPRTKMKKTKQDDFEELVVIKNWLLPDLYGGNYKGMILIPRRRVITE